MTSMRALIGPLVAIVASTSPRAPSASELRAILGGVLERARSVPGYLPDSQVLKTRPFVIREEIGSSDLKVPREALGASGAWALESAAALQAKADGLDRSVYFVVIEEVTVAGKFATVRFGTEVDVPKPKRRNEIALKVCCAVARDEYRNVAGRWKFTKRLYYIVY